MSIGNIVYSIRHVALGLPTPEKWGGLELAKTVGKNGYTVDTFLEDSKKFIGFESWMGGAMPSNKLDPPIDAFTIKEFAIGNGDSNPLYTDADYANNTKYGCLIAPPTIVNFVKYPVNRGPLDWGPYPLSGFPSGADWMWYDVMRVNDRFRSSMKVDEVFEKRGRTGRLCFTNVDVSMWNQSDDLIATCDAIFISVGREGYVKGEGFTGDKGMLYERPTYRYSEAEVEHIVKDMEAEDRRGPDPRYWEDVNVGDKLKPVVKGPYVYLDFITERMERARQDPEASFEVGMFHAANQPRKNPVTGWPYEARVMEHRDFNLCRGRGLPGPFDVGMARVDKNAHLLSNWMGDDGFIRRLKSSIRKPHYYGDTLWLSGEVIDKYKDNVENVEYAAVDILINGINQVGENSLPGKATVYLPSRELGEVVLPVPLPPKEEWKLITQREANDFVKEIESGETIFPNLPTEMYDYNKWLACQQLQ